MNAKTASEGSAFRDFSQQSEAFIRYCQELIWWELNLGPHPPPIFIAQLCMQLGIFLSDPTFLKWPEVRKIRV